MRVPSALLNSNLPLASAAHLHASAEGFQALLATASVQQGSTLSAGGDRNQPQVRERAEKETAGEQESSHPSKNQGGSVAVDTVTVVVASGADGQTGTNGSGSVVSVLNEDSSTVASSVVLQPTIAGLQTTFAGLWQRMAVDLSGGADTAASVKAVSVKASAQGTGADDMVVAQKKQKQGKAQSAIGTPATPIHLTSLPMAVQAVMVQAAPLAGPLGSRTTIRAANEGGAPGVDASSAEPERRSLNAGQDVGRQASQGPEPTGDRAAIPQTGESSTQPAVDPSVVAEAQPGTFAANLVAQNSVQSADGALSSANAQVLEKPEWKAAASGDSNSVVKVADPAGGISSASSGSSVASGSSPATGGGTAAPAMGAAGGSGGGAGSGAAPSSAPTPVPGLGSAVTGAGLTQAAVQAAMTHLAPQDAARSSDSASGATEAARAARAEDLSASAHDATEQTTAVSGVNVARVMQTMGQSEMRVEMRSPEFGDISIRTSIWNQQMQAQISLDHSALSQTLVTHLPMVQARLGEEYGLHASIEVGSQGAGFRGDSGGGSQHAPDSGAGTSRSRSSPPVPGVGSAVATTTESKSSGPSRSGGLDVTV
ncbi:MAG: hypothetical protein ACP5E5_11105 [Acidobacteriaceae bacterium]